MRKSLYLVIRDGNIVSSYHNKSQAKDDMITRNADVLTDALEQNEIDDLEIEDIEVSATIQMDLKSEPLILQISTLPKIPGKK